MQISCIREEKMSTKIKILFSLGLIAVLTLAIVVPTLAVHELGLFELGPAQEANITDDAGDGPDWGSIFDSNGDRISGGPGIAATFLKDQLSQSSATDWTTFSGAGGSNKNNDPIGAADCEAQGLPPDCDTWHWDTGNTPAKDDLSNVYGYAAMSEDHLIIYAGFERLDPDGDSHVDVEFFQDQVDLDEAPPCNDPGSDPTPCGFTGIRTEGDFVISMDFLQGGALGEVTIHTWNGTEYILTETIVGEGCNEADTACAFNNGTSIDGGPWPNYNRHGAVITNLPTNAFTEFGVDVTALIGETPCFTTFMGKTRSSQSFTAELKDFAGPGSFPICGASISIEPDDVNEVGQSHTFTVNANLVIGGNPDPAPDGTPVTVTLTTANGAVVKDLVDNCATDGTVGGSCTVTFTSASAGQVTGHATADITFGGHTFHVETDGIGSNSDDAVKRFVDAKISIGPDDTNSIGESHTFTVVAEQDAGDGQGFVDVPDDTIVTVTLTPVGATVKDLVDNCATGTASGSCTVTFTSDTPGTITGHAKVTVTISYAGESATLTRETDGSGGNSGDAVKTFVAGSLAWFKKDNAGRLQGGATFEVCRTHDRFGTDIPDECGTVTDNSSPDTDADKGEFKLVGLKLGRYTVDETIAPPGYEADPKVETVELTIAKPDVTIELAWVNQRPIIKLTEFGYTNIPTGTPTDGVVSGITAYTIKLKNFGGADASYSGTLTVVTNSDGGSLDCEGDTDISGELAAGGTEEDTFTVNCTYATLDDGSTITASLSEVEYELNDLTRVASGTPASIFFTIQSD